MLAACAYWLARARVRAFRPLPCAPSVDVNRRRKRIIASIRSILQLIVFINEINIMLGNNSGNRTESINGHHPDVSDIRHHAAAAKP